MMQTSEREDALSSPNRDVSAEADCEACVGMRDVLQGSDESFDVGVEEAAFILGVGRTRLSQLTSKGVFCFERRKIGTRNRLFYRRTDLETYLAETYGRSPRNPLAGLDPRRLAEELSPHLRDFADEYADDEFSACEEPKEVQPAAAQASQLRLTSRREPPARSMLQTARDVSQNVQHQALARESLDTLLRLGHLVEGLERRIQSLQLALTRLEARVTQAEPKLQSAASVLTASISASPTIIPRARAVKYRLPRK